MAGYSVTFSVIDNATKQIDQINRRMAQMRAPMERMSKSVRTFIDTSGLRRVAEGFAWVARAASLALRPMLAMIPALGAITGAATIGGMLRLVESFSQFGSELQRASDRADITTKQMQQFEDATKLAGGSADDMKQSLIELHNTAARAFVGADPQALAMFNQLGINIRDANGNLRNTADLMPEVIRKIEAIKDPMDRQRYATALLGDANAKLIETFRQSGRSFGDWMTDASKYTELNKTQLAQLRDFSQAQAKLGTAFDHLGQQLAAVLAKDFTPLMDKFADFVTKNQPQIIAAVDQMATAFADWTKGIDWNAVQSNLSSVIQLLNTMLSVLQAIGQALNDTAVLFGLANRKFTKEDVLTNDPWYSNLTDAQKAAVRKQVGVTEADISTYQQQQQEKERNAPFSIMNPNTWFGGAPHRAFQSIMRGGAAEPASQWPSAAPVAPVTAPLSPAGKALLQQIGSGESGGTDPYHELYGGRSFAGNQFPQWSGVNVGGAMTHAAGRYQFEPATWREAQTALNLPDFSPASQDKAAWWLAQRDYKARSGRDLATDLNDPKMAPYIGATLHPTWTSASGGAWAKNLAQREQLAANTNTPIAAPPAAPIAPAGGATTPAAPAGGAAAAAAAPPATVPGTPGANGNVDVTITHKNAPAGASVAATGTGNVNVAPPRVEHQNLAAA